MFKKWKRKHLGTKEFYLHVLNLAIPMIIQNIIMNFVSMLDNIMVGRVGTAQMSGVAIVNQYIFVFNLSVFGAISGAGIFGTQYYGKGDAEGQKYTVRFRLLSMIVLVAAGALVLGCFGTQLIGLFISADDTPELAQLTMDSAGEYLSIMLLSLLPFAITNVYASVERECGESRIPMISSAAAIGVNLILNYGLIYGKLGMPELGVRGAAIATIAAKCVECAVVVIWAHRHTERIRCMKGLYRGFYIPGELAVRILKKGSPLLCNEFLWSLGMSVIAQCYSVRGLDVVAARNIASTLVNIFGVVYIQLGGAVGIVIGATLGAGRLREAREQSDQITWFCVAITSVLMVLLLPIAKFFPDIYNTTPEIRDLAAYTIVVSTLGMPFFSYANAAYFTLRSGGKTIITFLFDSGYTWVVLIPVAFILTHFTGLEIHALLAVVTGAEMLKVLLGHFMLRSDMWINNIVTESEN